MATGADKAADAAHDAVDDLAVNARFANYKASNAIDDAVDQGSTMAGALAGKIRDNPLIAAGAALAIGYLIARLRRQSGRHHLRPDPAHHANIYTTCAAMPCFTSRTAC